MSPHSFIIYMWSVQTVMCPFSLSGRWLQSEKPRWSLSRHNGQVSRCMPLRRAMSTQFILRRPILVVLQIRYLVSHLGTNINQLCVLSFQRDIGKVVEVLYGDAPPPILMIGHSMGGAIAVHTAAANHVPSLLGLCVIDVVEGEHSPICQKNTARET